MHLLVNYTYTSSSHTLCVHCGTDHAGTVFTAGTNNLTLAHTHTQHSYIYKLMLPPAGRWGQILHGPLSPTQQRPEGMHTHVHNQHHLTVCVYNVYRHCRCETQHVFHTQLPIHTHSCYPTFPATFHLFPNCHIPGMWTQYACMHTHM